MLILVLKDSLTTFSSPCPCPGPWGSGPCPCPGPWGSGPCPCPGPCGSGSCPYPGPCGLVLVLVLIFSPCKDLFPLFYYSDLFTYYCSTCQCIQLVLIILTYVFPGVLLCVYKYEVYGLAMFFCYNHRYYKAYNIYGYNASLVFHLESSNENLKKVWSQVTQMRVIEMKNKCHKTPIVIVHQ